MRVSVFNHLDGLARDTRRIAVRAPSDMTRVVVKNGKKGARLARSFAKKTAGKHGKLYPTTISWEMGSVLGGFGAVTSLSGVYGPDASMPQGGMEFEHGSRNQPAHLDLNRSADIVGPEFLRDVRALPDKWFW